VVVVPDEDLSLLHLRAAQLAEARGDVPEDGSGVDGVWTDELPDADADTEWFVAMNADAEEREYRVTEDRTYPIQAFHAHYWWDTDLVTPAAITSPYQGQMLLTDEFDRSVEDQIVASVEVVLDDLGYDDFEAVVDGGASA
jgi:hypothetical protein